MYEDFLRPETVAALGATQFSYPKRFFIGASAGGVGPLFLGATPSSDGSDSISITGGLHFFTERLQCGFPTVYDNGAGAIVDDGVCRLTLLLQAGGTVPLSNNPVLLSLMGVPGRQNTPGSVDITLTGQPAISQAPHIQGFKTCNFLTQGGKFTHTFSNLSNVIAVIDVNWIGWSIPTAHCYDDSAFWNTVLKYQAPPMGS